MVLLGKEGGSSVQLGPRCLDMGCYDNTKFHDWAYPELGPNFPFAH